jgi:hypothetical protein
MKAIVKARMKTRFSTRNLAASFLSLAAFLLGFAHTVPANAAPVAVSAIPRANETVTPAHGFVRLDDVKSVKDVIVTAMDSPVCLRSEDAEIGTGFGWFGGSGLGNDKLVIERLIEGSEPALERTLVDAQSVSFGSATVLGRSRIRLVRIETGTELPVYAYRTAKAVHVLARRGFNTPSDGFDPDPRMSARTACGFWHVALDAKEDSAVVALVAPHAMNARARWVTDFEDLDEYQKAKVPAGDAPRFVLNVSVSKVTRDPEPILSVSVRTVQPPLVP